jgi:hypothetical protein
VNTPLLKTPGSLNFLISGWLGVLLVLPWVFAYTSGPTPNVWPWLLSACCVVVLYVLRDWLTVELIGTGWVVAAVLSALIGIVQYFGFSQVFSPWISQTGPAEAFANLRQRNQFATLTSIGLVALLGVLAQRTPSKPLPLWAHFAVFLLAIGNAVSGSRTGLLQWLLVLSLAAWWFLARQRWLAAFALQAVLAYLAAVVALPWVLSATIGLDNGGLWGRLVDAPTCASRRVLWSNVLHLIAQKPWLGWGWGELDYAHYITLYDGPRFCEILDNAHDLPLHLAVELGVPAALTLCCAFAWWVARQRPWSETNPKRQLAWSVLAVILLHSLLEYPMWYGPFQMAAGLCMLLLWRGAAIEGVPEYKSNKPLAQVVRSSLAIILIAFIAYAARDYHRTSQIYLDPQARDEAYRSDTLTKIRDTRLFRNQVLFAELSLTPLTLDNAQWTFDTATALLHYSPEPRVIEKVIESAVLLDRDVEALAHLARYRAAFPADHARWAQANVQVSGHLQRLN